MPLACPICRRPAAERTAEASPWPFCSQRCRLIDLGKWLGEEYRMPEGPDGSAQVPGLDEPEN
jgi:endogenous inhibitor of DNA gyrase (YacG/DUF329 family)